MCCWIGVDCVDAIYTACARIAHVCFFFFFYFTGESLFRSFLPLESSPFFFLFARSWSRGSRGSMGMWGHLVGLRGLMVPGRRGRTIGDGARTGGASLSSALVVSVGSVVTWGRKRLGEEWRHGAGHYKRKKKKKHFFAADYYCPLLLFGRKTQMSFF